MTLRLPTSSYGMNSPLAAKTINAAAARNNAAAGTSSWKMPAPSWSSGTSSSSSFPSLASLRSSPTGATGNPLYPAPRASSSSSLPIFGSSSLPNRPSGGILGGAGQTPSWSNWSSPSAASPAGSNLRMPTGFASNVFGPAGSSQPSAASSSQPYRVPGAQYNPQGQMTVTPDGRPINNSRATAGSVSYTPLQNNQHYIVGSGPAPSKATTPTPAAGSSPPPLRTGVSGPGTKTATDQFGRTFSYHDASPQSANQPVAGISANGTVLKTVISGNGQPYTYDTGIQAFTNAPPPPKPSAAPPVAVGRPTQTHQPVSTPVAVTPRPSAWAPPPPSQEDIEAANQGRWLS